jgi:hypothetical protein
VSSRPAWGTWGETLSQNIKKRQEKKQRNERKKKERKVKLDH